ncbi:MAG TPA: DEAD/DEAH box helicase [Planctomycetota bacterium]|nr:DEAD/DEAH box helicase [Planctomycetota bacterium]
MPLSTFHPAIQNWFKSSFEAPSPPQAAGWPHIRNGEDTLICAPTGSGKTLTAFMACLDSLFRQAAGGTLQEGVQVVYVSPLKALSNDIQKNLREPLEGIYAWAHQLGIIAPEVRVLVRTGDTLAAERVAMIKHPPHILVTTPESLFILLTSQKGRVMLKDVRTVIVDEIHALARDKRGAHLAVTLERLEKLCRENGKRPQRIGLSATQRPIELVAKFLVGAGGLKTDGSPNCAIVNLGHLRKVDLSIEIPPSPLQAVCSHETWEEVYERLTNLIKANRTTLIFVNTRRLCERLAAHLSKRLGEDKVTSHHGSLSRTQRLSAEERLKSGSLSALVATASLELGIDIGSVDLVCQIGVTHSIGTLLQRVGRAGHSLNAISRGKLFALTLEELMSAAALSSSIRTGLLDTLEIPDKPLDILAQQIVAESAAVECDEEELYKLVTRAYNYRDLPRSEFDEVLQMLSEGFTVRRGRASALVSYDAVGKRVRGRKGARLAAITSGGAIPDTADYQVVQEPAGIVVGTLNEDFAVESTPGDIFQLGNTSWKVLKIEPGRVRVEDAHGQPPSIPFWLGEAPGRSNELSQEVSRLRREIDTRLAQGGEEALEAAIPWTMDECGMERAAAEQLVVYLAESRRVLGVLPTHQTLVLERFFDEAGGMQLVVHTPFGRRINWAWGLALRKRFCRGFNFELQAAASENALLLSLGPQHSFPLHDVFHFLKPKKALDLLIQAMLEAPVFQTRWRWDACRSLALLRFTGGKKVPPPIMRMRSDDLMAAVFPHAAACPENLEGDREIPNHPLVREVIKDCLHEAMDSDGLLQLLTQIDEGKLTLVARDTTEPSTLAHEILTAKPYAFLDDAPLEERRTQAVIMRRGVNRDDAAAMGALDEGAIARVREEAWPEPASADELHDVLMMVAYLTENEAAPLSPLLQQLGAAGRATLAIGGKAALWIATERMPMFESIYGKLSLQPAVVVPEKERAKIWEREKALIEIVRGRLEVLGPVTVQRLAGEMALEESDISQAMLGLEAQGFALRGHFTYAQPSGPYKSQPSEFEWCERRLLARIHRYTLDRLRREIEPVTAADYLRFLFSWQHIEAGSNLEGVNGVREVIGQMQGLELPAVAWEREILSSRVKNYDRKWLDQLSFSGDVVWGRRFPAQVPKDGGRHSGQVRNSPIGLYLSEQLDYFMALAAPLPTDESHLTGAARQVLEQLRRRGAVFFQNLVRDTRRMPTEVEAALGELIAFGFVTGDGFGGLRVLLSPASKRREQHRRRRQMIARMRSPMLLATTKLPERMGGTLEAAGRWSLFRNDAPDLFGKVEEQDAIEVLARQLLRRWGVVFHRVLLRENNLPPWRDLLRVYRRMEARGELRGGRFVGGFSGEQYALPEAVEHLRNIRRTAAEGKFVTVCGADPLNLIGILTPGDKLAARASSRVVYRDGVPVAIREAGQVKILERDPTPAVAREIAAALVRKAM